MSGIRRFKIPVLKTPAAMIAAGFLATAALTGCDDAPKGSETAGTSEKKPELTPGASAESIKARKTAQLTLTLEPQGYLFIEGRHRFTQTRVFSETGGVGVTITKGKVCVSQGKECVEAEVAYRIDSGKKLALQQHYVATETLPDEATIAYWGVDDNGNPVSVTAGLQLELPKQEVRD